MPTFPQSPGAAFAWPPMYSFPPFFSKQPNRDTETKRIQLWRDLILEYCKYHRIFVLELRDMVGSPLFSNDTISRRLSQADVTEILQLMVSAGLAEWLGKDTNRCLIFWRRPTEWADAIYSWVVSRSLLDSVMTVYEIREGEATTGTEFWGMDELVLMKSLQILEGRGKAAILRSEHGGSAGVKWLA